MKKIVSRVRQILTHFIFRLWRTKRPLCNSSWYLKPIVAVFYCAELIYRSLFFLVNGYKCRHGGRQTPFTVIAVGNIGVGGSGKSVVVPFLVSFLGPESCAVMLRGYRGSVEKESKSYLLTQDGVFSLDKKILLEKKVTDFPSFFGDEATMFFDTLSCPIVVGKNRVRSVDLVEVYASQKSPIKYLILDDAYQNHHVAKSFEILLLDAHLPFGNGHCLPLGPLREKDISRADCIILTHADHISHEELHKTKNMLGGLFAYNRIFSGKHVPAGIFENNAVLISPDALEAKKMLLVSGVGSFDGVVATAQEAGIVVTLKHQLDDHHMYTVEDIDYVYSLVLKHGLDGIVTTAKDWVKLAPLLKAYNKGFFVKWFVLRVSFSFLTSQDHESFVRLLRYNR